MKRPHAKGGRKDEVPDDDEIWRHAAATIEPLKRGKPRVHPSAPAEKAGSPTPSPKAETAVSHKARSALNFPPAPPPKAQPPKSPALAVFDRSSVRKIRGGRAEIEARVDLHGMRQDEAHTALRAFLFRSQSRGLRFVLVITGKGKSASAADAPLAGRDSERGVLKRNVPRWLEEPDIRHIVVSYTTAAIRHGGEGALYVHLRTKDRT